MKRVTAVVMLLSWLTGPGAFAQEKTNVTMTAGPDNVARTMGAHPLSIREAEAIAIKNNPQITVGKLMVLVARQVVRETQSALLPQVSLSVTAVDSNPGSRIAAGGLTNPTVYPRAAAGASVSQLITDFGRTQNLVARSQYKANAQDENARATQQQIILAVDEAFYGTLEAKSLVHVAEETVKARQLLVDQVQALTDNKLRSDLDLSFSKVDLARAQILQLDTKTGYDASLATLSAILGYADSQDFELVEVARPDAAPAPDAVPLIEQALEARPEVRALEDELTAATKFSKAEHDLWRPTVSASGVVGSAPVRDDHIPNWYGAVGVNINIPVFNGFLFSAQGKSADLETELKRKQLQDLQNNVARDVRRAWLDTQKAYQRLSLTEQLRKQADLAVELAEARYRLGLASIVEYSQAELQKTDAELQDTDAYYQYSLTEIILAYQMGSSR